MKKIRWFAADPGRDLQERLAGYDHHRVEINGDTAVLITYITMNDPQRGLLAVTHPAADKHPEVPRWVKDAVARLTWEPTLPPQR